MPELPEVETIKEGLKNSLIDQKILKVYLSKKKLRFPYKKNFKKDIINKKIIDVNRRAKYILFSLSNGSTIISHLGMSGSYRIVKRSDKKNLKKLKHDHVVMNLEDFVVIYNDPRRFGYILLTDKPPSKYKLIKYLGFEPLSSESNAESIARVFHEKDRNIKNALMDQKIIAGLGNIYVCEAMFRAKVSPFLLAKDLVDKKLNPKKSLKSLVKNIKMIIRDSIDLGGSSLRDYTHTDGKMGYFQNTFDVYNREGKICTSKNCSQLIMRAVQSNRSTFFCPNCQKNKD